MIADLRRQLRLERPESIGGVLVFTDVAGAWAALAEEGARARFTIRMRRDVRAGWRVVMDQRRFRVVAALDADDRGARLDLICEEELP